jgi:hypothetical protein
MELISLVALGLQASQQRQWLPGQAAVGTRTDPRPQHPLTGLLRLACRCCLLLLQDAAGLQASAALAQQRAERALSCTGRTGRGERPAPAAANR